MIYYRNDLVLLLNARSIFSLFGIAAIVIFTWLWDRNWDKYGPENTSSHSKESKADQYETMEKNPEKNVEQDSIAKVENLEELKEALAFPTETFTQVQPWIIQSAFGWALIAISYFLPRNKMIGFDFSYIGLACTILTCILGYVQAIIIPKLVVRHKFSNSKVVCYAVMVAGMISVGVLTAFLDTQAPVFAAPMGCLFVAISHVLLWSSRHVGDSFDSDSVVNPTPVLYNFGGPLVVFGWFWFWIGLNTCSYIPPGWIPFLHVYTGPRAILAYVGAALIVFSSWIIGYALDEIEQSPENEEAVEEIHSAPAFGMFGYFCGQVFEIKVVSIVAWTVFGVAAFFPNNSGEVTAWLLFAASIGVGFSMAMIQEEGMRKQSIQHVETWLKCAVGLLASIGLLIPLQHGGHFTSVLLSVPAVVMLAYGIQFLLVDQKRGKTWLTTQKVQVPKVFSYGAILAPVGIIILAFALTMRPE